jgi:hypothetical protein
MQAMRRGSNLAPALLRQAGADAAAAPQLRQPAQAAQRRLASPQGTGMHGEGGLGSARQSLAPVNSVYAGSQLPQMQS